MVLAFGLRAQEKTLVLQIDTLVAPQDWEAKSGFVVSVENQPLWPPQCHDSCSVASLQVYPNFLCRIKLLRPESILCLPLDLNFGQVYFTGLYAFQPDTIRISRWVLYETQTLDSLIFGDYYYRIIRGVRSETYHKSRQKTVVKKEKFPQETAGIRINGKLYNLAPRLTQKPSFSLATGTSYRPRNYQKKNGDYKKRVLEKHHLRIQKTYFWGDTLRLDGR